jgi:phenylacetate-coenzyme A ligase PaaK-like adenylate-forming protein
MIRAALATTRLAASVALGRRFAPWSLDWIVGAMLATHAEFGALDERAVPTSPGAAIDEASRRAIQLRRMRELVSRARHTPYYARELAGFDEGLRGWDAFERLPVTTKAALRDDPDAFVYPEARVVMRSATTGTTGRPTAVCFSAHELATLSGLAAISFLARGDIVPGDVVHICSSPRAIGTTTLVAACARLGAVATVAGPVAPRNTLAQLAERRTLARHKPHVSVLACYPSHLGELIEEAGRRGVRPGDLAVERVLTGGEIVTAGLRRRAREALGEIAIVETYALTETLPLGGVPCSHGHLHFESSHGLAEIIGVESRVHARPGELGTLVLTPFPPFRETTLLLRYDTDDLVRPVSGPLACELQSLPTATSHVEGKRAQAIRTDAGLVCPRQILEALEALDVVPLPARYVARPVQGRVAIEVLVREPTQSAERQVRDALEHAGVPLRDLHLVEDIRHLQSPLSRRCDLREPAFARGQGPSWPWM